MTPLLSIVTTIIFLFFQLALGLAEIIIMGSFISSTKIKFIFSLVCALFVTFTVIGVLAYGLGLSLSRYRPDQIKEKDEESDSGDEIGMTVRVKIRKDE